MLNALSLIIVRATSLTNGVFIRHSSWNDDEKEKRSKCCNEKNEEVNNNDDVHINMFHVASFYWDTNFTQRAREGNLWKTKI